MALARTRTADQMKTLGETREPNNLQKFVARVGKTSLPIFCPRTGRDAHKTPLQIGSGVFYRFNACGIIITARHVCDASPSGKLQIRLKNPEQEVASFSSVPSERWGVLDSRYQAADVVCIPLGLEFATLLSAFSTFVTPAEVGHPDELVRDCDSYFYIAGFPHSRNKGGVLDVSTGQVRKRWGNVILGVPAARLPDSYLRGKPATEHFAIELPATVTAQSGATVPTPELHGMSGGPVWKLHVSRSTQMILRAAFVGIAIERHVADGRPIATVVRSEWAADPRHWCPGLTEEQCARLGGLNK